MRTSSRRSAPTFAEGVCAPTRHHHAIARPDGTDGTLLLMPAWTDFVARGTSAGGYVGVKIVTVNPDNNEHGSPAVMGIYFLADGKTGKPLALIDGQALTVWRTACASALAASYLARQDAARMTMVGAGKLAPHLIRAHAGRPPDPRGHRLEPEPGERRTACGRAERRAAFRSGPPATSKLRCAAPTSSARRPSPRCR